MVVQKVKWLIFIFLSLMLVSGCGGGSSSGFSTVVSTPTEGHEIIAEGSSNVDNGDTALARKNAINDALRSAVEQVVGTLFSAESLTCNFALIEDSILTKSDGYAKIKEIIEEKQEAGLYKVKITAKSPVSGKWDKVRIEQVITNLFSNAIKYGGGKPIDIQILKSWGSAKFIIKDRGMGIAASDQKVVFDLFRRSSGNSEHKNGLGVGLFISSQIVKMHGGNIKVTSTPVRGTNFTIELPLKRS